MKIFLAVLACCLIMNNVPDSSKDAALEQYDNAVQFIGNTALTSNLKGKRCYGVDHYTGTYVAEYEGFSDTEFIFGGTTIERKEGSDISINCTLRVVSGSAKVFCKSGSDDPVILIAKNGTYSGTVTIPAGSNYIGIECDSFTGSIELTVE